MVRNLLTISLILIIALFEGPSRALEPMSLPTFDLLTLDGAPANNTQLPGQGKWLLIYVRPKCAPCESLFTLLRKDPSLDLSQKVVVIFGGTIEEAKGMIKRFPDLAPATWYADPQKNAFSQLKLQSAPVVLGVRQSTVEWSISGLISDARETKSVLSAWVKD